MAAQHGLITSDQAHGIGLTTDDIAHRVERGEWIRLTRRVLASRSSTPTNLRRLLVHVLDAGSGSALSHTACLAHWGVRGFVDTPVHAVRHRQHLDHPVRGATIHEVRYLPWDLVRTLEGIPVVMPSLGLLQIAGMPSVHTDRLARAIDAAWSDRLVSHDSLMTVADRMSREGSSAGWCASGSWSRSGAPSTSRRHPTSRAGSRRSRACGTAADATTGELG